MVRLRLTLSVALLGRFCRYDEAFSDIRSGVTNSVDRNLLPSIRSRAMAYPRLRSPVKAARVVCGSHPVASVMSERIAPLDRSTRSMTRASLLPARGVSVLARSPTMTQCRIRARPRLLTPPWQFCRAFPTFGVQNIGAAQRAEVTLPLRALLFLAHGGRNVDGDNQFEIDGDLELLA